MKTTSKQTWERLESGERLALIDVRTPAEHEEVHIGRSHLAPLDRLDAEEVKRKAGDAESVVLVCGTGKRAGQAYEKLREAGLENLEVLEGGLTAWERAGLPVERGSATMSLERQVRIAAGALVLVGVALGTWVHGGFHGLSAFVGAGLIFAGITDWCGMGMLIAKMPWNQRAAKAD